MDHVSVNFRGDHSCTGVDNRSKFDINSHRFSLLCCCRMNLREHQVQVQHNLNLNRLFNLQSDIGYLTIIKLMRHIKS